jgi:hypothetical protein
VELPVVVPIDVFGDGDLEVVDAGLRADVANQLALHGELTASAIELFVAVAL